MRQSDPPAFPVKAKERILSIQVCRGLAAIIVVMAHLHNVEVKYFGSHWLDMFQFGVSGVDLFFVISGVVISTVTVGKFASAGNAFTFIYHRFARIYPIFWVYSSLVLAAFLYQPLWVNASSGHRAHIVRSFLLIPNGLPMLVMQGWTLSFELYFYVVFFVLLFLPARTAPWLLGLWALVVGSSFLWAPASETPVSQLLTSPMILEFLAGCAIFSLYRRSRLHPKAGIAIVALSLIWLGVIVFWTAHFHQGNQAWIEANWWVRTGLYGSFAALFLMGVMELERTGLVRFSSFLIRVGDWSFSIYLSHLILVELFGRLAVRYAPRLPGAILMVTVLSLPAILLSSYLSFNFLERPLIRMLYRPSRSMDSLPQNSGRI